MPYDDVRPHKIDVDYDMLMYEDGGKITLLLPRFLLDTDLYYIQPNCT